MAYCSTCDIHFDVNDKVCSSCGRELAKGNEPENIAKPVTVMDGREPFEKVAEQNIESQTGKGLIKPHSIEHDIDGFHFKYDKPSRSLGKVESMKDKVIEFRVTCPDPDEETPREISQPETVLAEPTPEDENIISMEIESPEVTESEKKEEIEVTEAIDPVSESLDQPSENEIWMTGEILAETTLSSPPETETKAPIELPEPELEIPMDTEILWEDSQRWLGIPLANEYRISTNSLQVMERLARKFSEVELTLISDVKIKQSWLDKLFQTGDLFITVKHLPDTGLVLKGVRHPENVRRLLKDLINFEE